LEVADPQAGDRVGQTGEHQSPRCLKVQVAAPAILVGQHVAVARRDRIPRRRDMYREQRMSQGVTDLTPIETRVRDDDLQAADE
jgi:hypothetical protein